MPPFLSASFCYWIDILLAPELYPSKIVPESLVSEFCPPAKKLLLTTLRSIEGTPNEPNNSILWCCPWIFPESIIRIYIECIDTHLPCSSSGGSSIGAITSKSVRRDMSHNISTTSCFTSSIPESGWTRTQRHKRQNWATASAFCSSASSHKMLDKFGHKNVTVSPGIVIWPSRCIIIRRYISFKTFNGSRESWRSTGSPLKSTIGSVSSLSKTHIYLPLAQNLMPFR